MTPGGGLKSNGIPTRGRQRGHAHILGKIGFADHLVCMVRSASPPTRWLSAHSLGGFPSPPVPFGAARRIHRRSASTAASVCSDKKILPALLYPQSTRAAAGRWANQQIIQPAGGVALLGECCSAAVCVAFPASISRLNMLGQGSRSTWASETWPRLIWTTVCAGLSLAMY